MTQSATFVGMKPVLALDADGVIVDFTTPALAYINSRGRHKTLEQVTDWCVFDNDEAFEEEYKCEVVGQPGFCRNMKPYPGAVEFARAAQKEYEVVIVTAPYDVPHWYEGRRDWIVEHLGLSRKKVNFVSEKQYFDSDILVDDKTTNIQTWANRRSSSYGYEISREFDVPAGKGRHVPILFEQPWNRNDFVTFNIHRAKSYQGISDILEANGFPPVRGSF